MQVTSYNGDIKCGNAALPNIFFLWDTCLVGRIVGKWGFISVELYDKLWSEKKLNNPSIYFWVKGSLLHQISVLVTIIQHTKRNKGGAWPSWTSERLSTCATLFCSLWIFTKRWSSRKLRTVQTSPCNFSTTSYKNQSNVRNSKYVLLINS